MQLRSRTVSAKAAAAAVPRASFASGRELLSPSPPPIQERAQTRSLRELDLDSSDDEWQFNFSSFKRPLTRALERELRVPTPAGKAELQSSNNSRSSIARELKFKKLRSTPVLLRRPANLAMSENGTVVKCHRCSALMRTCVRRLVTNGVMKEYPSFRCTRKGCQTFKSPRTLDRNGNKVPTVKRKRKYPKTKTGEKEDYGTAESAGNDKGKAVSQPPPSMPGTVVVAWNPEPPSAMANEAIELNDSDSPKSLSSSGPVNENGILPSLPVTAPGMLVLPPLQSVPVAFPAATPSPSVSSSLPDHSPFSGNSFPPSSFSTPFISHPYPISTRQHFPPTPPSELPSRYSERIFKAPGCGFGYQNQITGPCSQRGMPALDNHFPFGGFGPSALLPRGGGDLSPEDLQALRELGSVVRTLTAINEIRARSSVDTRAVQQTREQMQNQPEWSEAMEWMEQELTVPAEGGEARREEDIADVEHELPSQDDREVEEEFKAIVMKQEEETQQRVFSPETPTTLANSFSFGSMDSLFAMHDLDFM